MKNVNPSRFLRRKPESISFQISPISSSPVELAKPVQPPQIPTPQQENVANERTSVRSNISSDAQVFPSGNHYAIIIPRKRNKIRHSFDVYEDQKIALDKLQLAISEAHSGKKPALGELIQEAIDLFIRRKAVNLSNFTVREEIRGKTNERTDVRSSERVDIK